RGQFKSGRRRDSLDRYLDVLQGRDAGGATLSGKYLDVLREALRSQEASVLLDPLRAKFRDGRLKAADIQPWQQSLWRFATVGHIGRTNGPKAWLEPVTPLVTQQEMRIALGGNHDPTWFLVTSSVGPDDGGDTVVWENPRLVAKGRPDLAVGQLPELVQHLQSERARIIASTEACLAAMAGEPTGADPQLLKVWGDYLGWGETALAPLLSTKLERTPDYDFIRGWTGARDLSVLANSADATVRIPGIMQAHSVATHPAPDQASVIAWRSPGALTLRISGDLVHAHPECGNGVAWALEVRRGHAVEQLAAGTSERSKVIRLGPFDDVRLEAGQVVALVVGPRDGNHACDLTTVNLTLDGGAMTWDLARDVSPNILAGNPHGPWHFLSQPAGVATVSDLPDPLVRWRRTPSREHAAEVRRYLEQNFPLTHPLLAPAMRAFRAAQQEVRLMAKASSVRELRIPAELAQGAELVVTARAASARSGGAQARVLAEAPGDLPAGVLPEVPILVGADSEARQQLEADLQQFRHLFPRAVCYTRIVPVDEVVTLTLYHREDEQLCRLLLDDAQVHELDRLWSELLFVSEAPLKQVDAFEQIYQFATQDRPDLVNDFEPLREPILKAAAAFRERQRAADAAQRQAVIELAARAWRRPLSDDEVAGLQPFPPRLMLARVLTSPSFLYRGEQAREQTGPINDWELATRLSYFLWSSLPDDELRALAAAGRLRNPDVLAAQTRRMLKDDRVRRLATEFGCQWLHVRDVATLDEKSDRHFPTFVGLRADMQEEVTRFFVDFFQRDESVLALLEADHTFLSKKLADHYGLTFAGDDWQRVEGLRAHGRGGILGFAATLSRHSGASRTSAILRGTWLSEVVLGDKLPNPPKGVPVLPDEAPAGLTERQLIERHSSDANCSGCHQRIDPYGYALEGFDAIGRARNADTATTLHDGTNIDGLAGLREYLLTQRRQDFLRQFGRKLLGYALGRSVQLSDQPLIETLVQTEGTRSADWVERIVRSRQFREVRGRNIGTDK
ncbi:MAG: DUF1592 domain-containing protein, partial [Pirellulaceae bacterium]